MINPNTITQISEAEGVSWAVVEKDYFLTLLLEGVAQTSLLKRTFVFKGGTALRKSYIVGYRYSEDLEFTLRKNPGQRELRGALESALEYLEREHNAEFRIKNFNSKSYFTDIKVQFTGLKRTKSIIAFDLSPDEIIVEEPRERTVFNPYYGKEFSIPTYTLDEIVAEKMRSLLQRTRVRDYYDVWYLLTKKKKELDGKKIRKIFLKKAEYKKIRFTGKEQLLDKDKLEQARAYYEAQLGSQIKNLPPFGRISEELESAIKALDL